MKEYDVVVIGSGPGGYVAAVRAGHLGLKAAIVEKESTGRLGGTCLLRGCIPTKAMLHSAEVLEELRHAKDFGIAAGEVSVDFAGVQKWKDKAVTKSASGVNYLMKQNGVDVYKGAGRLQDPNTVVIEQDGSPQALKTRGVIVATGSVPKQLPFLPVDGKHVVTSDEILELERPPKSLVVLGAGAVGVEFASIFRDFGAEVTVVEMLDRLVPNEDREVSLEFEKLFRKRGVAARTATKLETARVADGAVVCELATPNGSETLQAEMVLVAIGRGPVTRDLGLQEVGVQLTETGHIPVDATMSTNIEGIYAIGDIVPTPWLAHTASAEGIVAVDHIAGNNPTPINYDHTPYCTYSNPEVASVGLSEEEAKQRGYAIKTGKFPFSASGKARIMGQTQGFVKIISDKRYDEVLGVHIVGPRATDLIAEACVGLSLETTTEALANVVHAHPTLTEAVMEAAHGAMHRPIHL